MLHCVLLESLLVQHVTLLQTKAIQIQEATLLVKQPVAELELLEQVELTLQTKV
jgi:hypothetical protein